MLNQFKGTILILISALAFGSYGLFSKWLVNYDIFYQTYIRCFIVALLIGIIAVYRKEFRKIDKEDYGWFALVLIFTAFTVAPITYAFRYLELGTASFLFYASFTIFTYILGFIFFKEKLTLVKIISLIIAIIGLLMVFSVKFSAVLLLPILMAIFNGLASSGEVTFSKKISEKYSSSQIVFLVFLFIGITHLPISFLLGENQDLKLFTQSFLPILGFAVVAIIGMYTIVAGYKYLEPSIGAIIGLSEIVFSVIFGYLFFKESLNMNILIGGLLIIIATALPSIREYVGAKKQTGATINY